MSQFTEWWVTKPTAAGGRYREAEKGKVTSNREGIYAVEECDDNFSGRAPFEKIKKVSNFRYLLFTKWWERMDIAGRGLKTVHRTVLLTPCSNPFLCATKTLPHKFY